MFKTKFNYDKMAPREREMLEAMSARVGEDKAARAFEISLLAEEVFMMMKIAGYCEHHSQEFFTRFMKALFYSGPTPDLDDVSAITKMMTKRKP